MLNKLHTKISFFFPSPDYLKHYFFLTVTYWYLGLYWKLVHSRASQHWHYLPLGLGNSLLWRDCPVYCKPFSSIPGIYPVDANSTLPNSYDNEKCLNTVRCLLSGRHLLQLRTTALFLLKIPFYLVKIRVFSQVTPK